MNDIPCIGPASGSAAGNARRAGGRVGTTAWRPCEALSRPGSERIRFRWQLQQMSKDNPHLIDDIGLTRRQVEAEIAKRFWQA